MHDLSTNSISSSNAASNIIKSAFVRNVLAVVIKINKNLILLLNTKCKSKAFYKLLELQIEAQVRKFNFHFDTTKLPKCMLPLWLTGNLNL